MAQTILPALVSNYVSAWLCDPDVASIPWLLHHGRKMAVTAPRSSPAEVAQSPRVGSLFVFD